MDSSKSTLPGKVTPRFRFAWAAALLFMSFSYSYGANPMIDWPRLMIADTVAENCIFQDSEIIAAYNIETANFQSSMFYSYPSGNTLPSTPQPYRRVAALLLDAIAANKSRLSSILQLLDVKMSPDKAAIQLRAQAAALRDTDDNNGSFFIIEQVHDVFSFRQRFWSQVQREQGT